MVSLLLFVQSPLVQFSDALGVDAGDIARGAFRVAMIWLGAWIAWVLVRIAAKRIIDRVDDGDPNFSSSREKRGQTIAQILRSAGRVVILLLAGLLTLNQFIEIGPLLAGVGVLGLAVSFGAQSLVKDVFTGFFMLMEEQFAVGDVIEAGGKSGVVERITLRVVQLRDLRGVVHVIPNGEIKAVSNMTYGWSRAVVDISVGYGEDINRTLDVIRDEAARFEQDPEWKPLFDGGVELLGVEDLGDNAVVVRVLLRTVAGKQWGAAREFRRRIKNRFDREGIEIPFPQRTVHVRAPDGRTLDQATIEAAGRAGGA